MVDSLQQPKIPGCTICLVVCTVVFNYLVLLGNQWTAAAMTDIGQSTKGWSNVGLSVAQALREELDEQMNNVSERLLEGLQQVAGAQGNIDMVLSMVGAETDAAISNSTELSLLEMHGPEKGLALLQEQHGKTAKDIDSLTPIIINAVDAVLDNVMNEVTDALHTLLEKIKPALEKVGEWIIKFGEKITKGLEEFSVTLDKAQKMFDQVMAQLNGPGENEEEMIAETWILFDTDDSGEVDAEDLLLIGEYYSITALQGSKPQELVTKYDADGGGDIGIEELGALVNDPSIAGCMSVILRKYAKRLSEIAGNVGRAKQRDEVAKSVTNYVRLVCAKNLTKVTWIADRLGNDSVPLDFTGNVFVQMCLIGSDPNAPVYSTADSGALLTDYMFALHPQAVLDTLDLMGNASWYASQGFDINTQPKCAKMMTGWVAGAKKDSLLQGGPGVLSLLEGVSVEHSEELQLLETMPDTAFHLATEGVQLYRLDLQQERHRKRSALFSSKTQQQLLNRLLGGVAASDVGGSNAAQQALAGGIPAAPETLEFAEFLSNNATATAAGYQDMCFEYSSESSNSAEDFATKIQGMVKKVESFIAMMEKFATPAGIAKLERQIEEFATGAIQDVKQAVEERLVGLINQSMPKLESAIHQAAHDAGERLGNMIGQVIAKPMSEALTGPLADVLGEGGNGTGDLGEQLGEALGSQLSNLTAGSIGEKVGDLLEGLVDKALDKAAGAIESATDKLPSTSLLAIDAVSIDKEIDMLFSKERLQPHKYRPAMMLQSGTEEDGLTESLSGAWQNIVNLLRSFSNLLPRASDILKEARSEVTKLSSQLDSIFNVFEEKGPAIFDGIADTWIMIWTIYFIFLLPFCGFQLYYGFWANGWFGGPQPIAKDEHEPPTSFSERCSLLCRSCTIWCSNFHDTSCCFWSIIIFMQVIVLVTFVISIALCIVAAVKAFIVAGCAQIYVLGDNSVCEGALNTIKSFLETFHIGEPEDILSAGDIAGACEANTLLTCQMVSEKMTKSTVYTTVFSFLASIFCLQSLFDSATLHEQAVWRRKAATMVKEEGKTD